VVSEVAEALSEQESRSQIDALMRELRMKLHERNELESKHAKAVQEANDQFVPDIDTLNKQITELIEQINDKAKRNFWSLVRHGTKTIYLRYGEISHRISPVSLNVYDEKKLRRAIWRRRLVNQLTKLKREISTKALKEYLLDNPDVTLPGARLERGESFIIKPGKTTAEITVSVPAGTLETPKED
jgi:phage host-nuclease inhibitor protein Gam